MNPICISEMVSELLHSIFFSQGPATNRLAVLEYYWKMLGDKNAKEFVPLEASILNHFKPALAKLEDAGGGKIKGSSGGSKGSNSSGSKETTQPPPKNNSEDENDYYKAGKDYNPWESEPLLNVFTSNQGDVFKYFFFEEWYISLYAEGEGAFFKGKPAITVIHKATSANKMKDARDLIILGIHVLTLPQAIYLQLAGEGKPDTPFFAVRFLRPSHVSDNKKPGGVAKLLEGWVAEGNNSKKKDSLFRSSYTGIAILSMSNYKGIIGDKKNVPHIINELDDMLNFKGPRHQAMAAIRAMDFMGPNSDEYKVSPILEVRSNGDVKIEYNMEAVKNTLVLDHKAVSEVWEAFVHCEKVVIRGNDDLRSVDQVTDNIPKWLRTESLSSHKSRWDRRGWMYRDEQQQVCDSVADNDNPFFYQDMSIILDMLAESYVTGRLYGKRLLQEAAEACHESEREEVKTVMGKLRQIGFDLWEERHPKNPSRGKDWFANSQLYDMHYGSAQHILDTNDFNNRSLHRWRSIPPKGSLNPPPQEEDDKSYEDKLAGSKPLAIVWENDSIALLPRPGKNDEVLHYMRSYERPGATVDEYSSYSESSDDECAGVEEDLHHVFKTWIEWRNMKSKGGLQFKYAKRAREKVYEQRRKDRCEHLDQLGKPHGRYGIPRQIEPDTPPGQRETRGAKKRSAQQDAGSPASDTGRPGKKKQKSPKSFAATIPNTIPEGQEQ